MNPDGMPRPRHQYMYCPQFGRRGIYAHQGQIPNGAPYTGVVGGMGGYMGGGYQYPGVGYYPQSYNYYYPYRSYYNSYYPSTYYPSTYYHYGYGSYYGSGLNTDYYYPYQRSYYYPTAAVPTTYVMPTAQVAPAVTTYTVANSQAIPVVATAAPTPLPVRVRTREDIQMENRRIATSRGAYTPKPIKPADARPDDSFWCRERNGEWHVRSYYQIENECHPGRWLMDAERGYLVFHRH